MDLWSPKRPLYQLSHSHQGTFLPEFVFVRNFSKQADVGRQMVLMESQIGKTRIKILTYVTVLRLLTKEKIGHDEIFSAFNLL